MSQYNAKERLTKLYSKYLSGNISRDEYEELFDLIRDEANQHLVEAVIDGTLPEHVIIPDEKPLQEHMDRQLTVKPKTRISRRMVLYRISAAAAVLLLIVSLFFMWRGSDDQWIVFTTDYQETKKVDLPDGSTVELNASSELKWKKGFEKEKERMVSFTGEGYFEVAHLDGKGFTVKTGTVDVRVLGTEFNLETRRDYTNVFLKEGKVVLEAEAIQPVEMKPGDMVHYDEKKKKVHKASDQKPESALSWKDGVFTFEDLTGIQILEKMEDIYGKEFIIKEPGKLEDVIVVQGLPYADWDFTREALELALDVQFKDSTSNKIIVNTK